ncbi:hypothetical protein Poly51_13080 [Rubripirellula tenax]|uniref:Uncharacterized protein n=1 Tax=Rubripirellula tenax TaxID=2528015 RepID=A0A5C6FFW5_9BACT|nr:hypothetical protein [Rubripirellula tenax]TWU58529.1 hypothetical protein Poly51_13080 [Rubripirellula tenax]
MKQSITHGLAWMHIASQTSEQPPRELALRVVDSVADVSTVSV